MPFHPSGISAAVSIDGQKALEEFGLILEQGNIKVESFLLLPAATSCKIYFERALDRKPSGVSAAYMVRLSINGQMKAQVAFSSLPGNAVEAPPLCIKETIDVPSSRVETCLDSRIDLTVYRCGVKSEKISKNGLLQENEIGWVDEARPVVHFCWYTCTPELAAQLGLLTADTASKPALEPYTFPLELLRHSNQILIKLLTPAQKREYIRKLTSSASRYITPDQLQTFCEIEKGLEHLQSPEGAPSPPCLSTQSSSPSVSEVSTKASPLRMDGLYRPPLSPNRLQTTLADPRPQTSRGTPPFARTGSPIGNSVPPPVRVSSPLKESFSVSFEGAVGMGNDGKEN